MAAAPGQKLGKDGKKDSDRQPDANLGNHGLRARQSKVDYCELKNKPHQLYRTAVVMQKDKPLKLPKRAEEDVPVQLPGKVEPWPVWIKHSAKGLTAYALWINAAEMMKDSDTPGQFLMCSDHRHTPVQHAQPVAYKQLSDQVKLVFPNNYRRNIKLGRAFQFPCGDSFEEGDAILKVLQYAWETGARTHVGKTLVTPGPELHTPDLIPTARVPRTPKKPRGLKPKPLTAGSKSQRLAASHNLKHGPTPRNLPPLPEYGQPVRVHVTHATNNITVYGLWTNAQAAIAACQAGPLLFVQCEQDTYQPVTPEVKYRNDKFNMLTGLPSSGCWRQTVKLDQQLPTPGGPTFEPGTSLAQVFRTLLKLKAGQGAAIIPAYLQGRKRNMGVRSEEVFTQDVKAGAQTATYPGNAQSKRRKIAARSKEGICAQELIAGNQTTITPGNARSRRRQVETQSDEAICIQKLRPNQQIAVTSGSAQGRRSKIATRTEEVIRSQETVPLSESGEPVRVHVTYHRANTTVYGLWTNAQAAIAAGQMNPLIFVQCQQDTYQPINPEIKYRNEKFNMLTGLPTCGGWRKVVKLDQQLSIPDGPTFEAGTSLTKVFDMLRDLKKKKRKAMAPDHVQGKKSENVNGSEKAAGKEVDHTNGDKRGMVVKLEQQDAITYEVIVIDNGPWETGSKGNSGCCHGSKKRPGSLMASNMNVSLRKRAKTTASPMYTSRARTTRSSRK